MYSQAFIENVRESNDIVDVINSYVRLQQKGGSHVGLCPFHNEKTPSFSVSADKQLYHCFGCGASGNIYTFIMEMDNLDFVEALEKLAERANIALEQVSSGEDYKKTRKQQEIQYEIMVEAAKFFYNTLEKDPKQVGIEYLEKRGISSRIRKQFGLGYASNKNQLFELLKEKGYSIEDILLSGLIVEKNGKYYDKFYDRLMFPIFEHNGKVVGFGGRVLDDSLPKYLNSPETIIFNKSKLLYGLNRAKLSKAKEYILVEGYVDVIALHEFGITNAVGVLGTAFNANHVKTLRKFTDSVICLFDSDDAGIAATKKSIKVLVDSGFKVKVLVLEGAKDPDEYIKKFGIESFEERLSNAISNITFEIIELKKIHDLENPSEVLNFTKKAVELLKTIENNIERDVYIKEIVKITGLRAETLQNEVEKNSANMSKIQEIKTQSYTGESKQPKNVSIALNNLINNITADKNLSKKIENVLKPSYIIDETYSRILAKIYELHNSDVKVTAVLLMDYFLDKNEQKIISSIFSTYKEYEDDIELNKVLTDQCKTVLNYYIDVKSTNITQMEDIVEFANMKKSVTNFTL